MQKLLLKVDCFQRDEEDDTYIIQLSEADLVSHDKEKHILSFKITSKNVQFPSNHHRQITTKCDTELSDILDDDQMEFLLDEIAMENDQQSRRNSKSLNNNHKTILSEIISEWNLNFNPQKTNKSDSNSTKSVTIIDCNGCNKSCKPSQRIQFILKYYAEWVKHKHAQQLEIDDEIGMMPSPSFSCVPSPSKVSFILSESVCIN